MITFDDGLAATLSFDFLRPETAPTHGDDWARIVGTTGVIEARNDTIDIASGGWGSVSINLNGTDEGTFSTYGPILVYGQGGQDEIDRAPDVRNPAYLVSSSNRHFPQAAILNDSIRWAGLQAALDFLNR